MNKKPMYHGSRYIERYRILDERTKKRVKKTLRLFEQNPFHPSLRLHKLSGKMEGYWSISVTMQYRIILDIREDQIILISVGTHAIYE
jgi:addiction module RelE/StbE family toxin